MLINPDCIAIIPLRRNFYRPRKYLLWRSIEISFAAYVVCRSLISSLRRKIYLSKTISLPSLRYYKSWLQNGQSLRSCPATRVYNFLPAINPSLRKSSYVRTSCSIRFYFSEQLKYSYFSLAGRASTDQTLTIKYSRNNVDERVSNEIRSGLGRR